MRLDDLKGAVFDVDGTLVNSNSLHATAWCEVLAGSGYNVSPDQVLPLIGMGGEQLVRHLVDVDETAAKDLAARATASFESLARASTIAAFPGAQALLGVCQRRGIKTAIATSAKRSSLDAIVDVSGLPLPGLVDVIVTGDEVTAAKPAPNVVSRACEALGLAPGDCVMVGDTPYDAEAARRAGLAFFGVATGAHSVEALQKAGAELAWLDLSECLSFVSDLQPRAGSA